MKYISLAIFLFFGFQSFAQNGIIRGRVFNSINNEPLPFTNVIIIGTDIGASTDDNGNYEIKGLQPGLYSLKAAYLGFQEKTIYEVQVTNAKPAVVDFAMQEAASQLQEVVVQSDPFRKTEESPLSLQTLGIAEIERNAGANRDISRVIQSLPGVASTVNFRNDIIIRGGGPNENRFYLDGIEIPVINHFATQGASGGPVGMINVNFLKEASLYTGAFPASKGNTLSSVLELTQKDGRSDRLGGSFTLGASDIGLTAEGPLGEKATFIASVRRSYLQFLFGLLELPFLPTYNDAQFKIKLKPGKDQEITLLGIGAIDDFKLNLEANETPYQQYLLEYLPVTPQWNYTVGAVYKYFHKNSYSTITLSRSELRNEAYKYLNNDESDPSNLIQDYESSESGNKFRSEHVARAGNWKWVAGAQYEWAKYTNSTYNKIFTSSGPEEINYSSELDLHLYGAYFQLSRTMLQNKLTLSAGTRADGNTYNPSMQDPLNQFSPRLSASYEISPRFSINANTGIYYQLPPYTLLGFRNSTGELVNQDRTEYIRSTHFVAGVAYSTASNTRITVESFWKIYADYPFLLRDSISLANIGGDYGVVGNEPAASTAEGRAYGAELFIQQKLFKGFYGLLAYTFVRSEFENKKGELAPSAWDYRHFLSMTGGKKFNKNWEAGLRFRAGAGIPYTPDDIFLSSLKASWDVRGRAIPDYNRLNALRLEPYHYLDIRVDKKYYWKKISLNIYLDVQNIYNFTPAAPPILYVEKDITGDPLTDPQDPLRYKVKYLDGNQGSILPTLGIILEY